MSQERQPATAGTDCFYTERAAEYAARGRRIRSQVIDRFIALLPPDGQVLELGCGGGQDAAEFIARGIDLTPTDGVPAMAEQAALLLGRPVGVLRFEDFTDLENWDGIWANASLHHAPLAELPGLFTRIHTALRPGGVLSASLKLGDGEGVDSLGRYYARPTLTQLTEMVQAHPWTSLALTTKSGSGFDGESTDWAEIMAVK